MVNTFLVDGDFSKSASLLDNRRLVKQRCEAQQILNILLFSKALAAHYKIRIPSITASRGVKRRFFNLMYQVSKKQPQHLKCLDKLPVNKIGAFVLTNDNIKHVKNIKKYKLQENELIVKMGFSSHPAVIMWYGYEDALKEYIEAHIAEHIKRGYKNTMKRYVNIKGEHPKWTRDENFHKNHKAALLNKELTRNEKPWYQLKSEFQCIEQFTKYIWPNNT